jgi:hypothetical protein
MKRIIIALVVMASVFVFGCTPKPIGGDKDAHGCLTAAGYSWCEAKQKCLRTFEENCTEQVIGGDKDEHGCLIAAGYSWCEAKQKCLKAFEESCTGIVGNDSDEHGCKASAGYTWCESKQRCLRPFEENCTAGTDDSEHICTAEESANTACTLEYMPVCGRIVLNMGKTVYQTYGNGCSACAAMKVVSYAPGECPPEKTTDMCSDLEGNYLTITEAKEIARASECNDTLVIGCVCPDGYRKDGEACNPECYYSTPRCLAPSVQCEKTYFCNEGTGTYWISTNITKPGCNPACVVDVGTQTAEINWRCTGLITN